MDEREETGSKPRPIDGSQVWVHGLPESPLMVKKVLKPPEEIVGWWERYGHGRDLGQQPHAAVPGDSLASARHKYERAFESIRLSYNELREETGLITLHLDEDPPHFVQEKAILLIRRLESLEETENTPGAERSLDDLLEFILNLWMRDYTEDTFNFLDNYGYGLISGRFIMVDVGGVVKDRRRVLSEMWRKGIYSHRSYATLLQKFPNLALYLRTQFDRKFPLEAFLRYAAKEPM